MATFVEYCKQDKTTDTIAVAKYSVSDEDSNTKRHKKRSKFKEREENGKKRHKKNFSLYWSLHGENKCHSSGECKVLKARNKNKYNSNYFKKDCKKKFK